MRRVQLMSEHWNFRWRRPRVWPSPPGAHLANTVTSRGAAAGPGSTPEGAPLARASDAPALVLATSGSTGAPKRVILTLRNRTLPAYLLSSLNESPLQFRFAGGLFLIVPALVFIFVVRRYLFSMWGIANR